MAWLEPPLRRVRDFLRSRLRQERLRAAARTIRSQARRREVRRESLEAFRRAWGNRGFTADLSYVELVATRVLQRPGAFLECGSGLTTAVAGMIADESGGSILSLEQDPEWASKTISMLDLLEVESARVVHAPLREMGDFSWYDLTHVSLPDHFAAVFVDGPAIFEEEWSDPLHRSWRLGLVPRLEALGVTTDEILLDDADDPRISHLLPCWSARGLSCEVVETDTGPVLRATPLGR